MTHLLQSERYAEHDEIGNRRLLWHGTNVAVVAAILKTGLRIMPHSGGRVGRGIYFASEHGKSAGYGESASNSVLTFFFFVNRQYKFCKKKEPKTTKTQTTKTV